MGKVKFLEELKEKIFMMENPIIIDTQDLEYVLP